VNLKVIAHNKGRTLDTIYNVVQSVRNSAVIDLNK